MVLVALVALASAAKILVPKAREYSRIADLFDEELAYHTAMKSRADRREREALEEQKMAKTSYDAMYVDMKLANCQIDKRVSDFYIRSLYPQAMSYRLASLCPWLGVPHIEFAASKPGDDKLMIMKHQRWEVRNGRLWIFFDNGSGTENGMADAGWVRRRGVR
jgi:hypothetical protein